MKQLWIYSVVLVFGTLSYTLATAQEQGTVGVNAPKKNGSVRVVKPEQQNSARIATEADRARANRPKKVGSSPGTVEVNAPPEQKRHRTERKESRTTEGSVEVRPPSGNTGKKGGVSVVDKPKSALEASVTKKQSSKSKRDSSRNEGR